MRSLPGRQRRTLILISACFAALLSAASARGEVPIYIAEQPGFSITLKAEGRHVFVSSLQTLGYCRGAGGAEDRVTETEGKSFLGGPEELERKGNRLRYFEKVTDVFYSRTGIKAEIRADAIVGTYFHETSSSGEGDGGCQSGGFDDPRVSFEARRYAPVDSGAAVPPDPNAPAIYFGETKLIEIYLWAKDGSVSDVRTTVAGRCIRPHRKKRPHRTVERTREAPTLHPPFPISPADGSFSASWGFGGAWSRSSRFFGTVEESAARGSLSETETLEHRGQVVMRCHSGIGKRGWVPFQATRYLPVG